MSFLSLSLCVFVISSATADVDTLRGPCREWLWPCEGGRWVCNSEEAYQQYIHGIQPSCPQTNVTPPEPPGQCRLINGSCQYNNSTLECDTWVPHNDYRYTCGLRDDVIRGGFGTPPTPDEICVSVNDTCQWFNPCRYWRGHCLAPYRCGTLDEYYAFIFGPTPLCASPPEQWVEPAPPGECVVDQEQQCNWSNCTAYMDWCQFSWTCGSQYDKAVYFASPPPPCPPPPPGHTPPPQPGICQFNISSSQCQFLQVQYNYDSPCVLGSVSCNQPNHVFLVNSSSSDPLYDSDVSSCMQTCASNSDCMSNQICEERPYCEGNALRKLCINISSEYDACHSISCDQPDHICVVNTNTSPDEAVCLRKCAVNNGGCKEGQTCLESPYCSGCTLTGAYCQDNKAGTGTTYIIVGVGSAVGSAVVLLVVLIVAIGIVLFLISSFRKKKDNFSHKKLLIPSPNVDEVSVVEKKDISLE